MVANTMRCIEDCKLWYVDKLERIAKKWVMSPNDYPMEPFLSGWYFLAWKRFMHQKHVVPNILAQVKSQFQGCIWWKYFSTSEIKPTKFSVLFVI